MIKWNEIKKNRGGEERNRQKVGRGQGGEYVERSDTPIQTKLAMNNQTIRRW
jgi:hypothetical protein